MLKYLIKGILAGIAIKLLDDRRTLSLQLLKLEALKCYLHGVQVARFSAIGLMTMGLVIGLICFGVLLFHAGLFILLPWQLETKAIVSMFLGLAYMVFGAAALYAAMNQKTWMIKSGALKMIRQATGQSKID